MTLVDMIYATLLTPTQVFQPFHMLIMQETRRTKRAHQTNVSIGK